MGKVKRYLKEHDAERIRKAVAQAESRTCGEIVPMVVRSSHSYGHLNVMGGMALAVTAFVVVSELRPWIHSAWLLISEVIGYLIGSLIFRIDGIKRLFLTKKDMDARVYSRALRGFYEHELHKTKESTGILILASLLERRVQILADHGIHEKVGDAEWRKAANLLTRALKEKRAADGFCEAIALCGDVLARHFPAAGKNPNELPDKPIQEK